MNIFLCISVVMLVLIFRSSSALAGAYGFAVGGAMLVDTLLASYVARHFWRWMTPIVALVFVPFFLFDITFFTTATAKIPEGGWLPLSVGVIILTIFVTWKQGRAIAHEMRHSKHQKLETFLNVITPEWPPRVPGTSVYLAPSRALVPSALVSSLYRNQVLRENVIVLKILKEDVAEVAEEHQCVLQELDKGFWKMGLRYGFMQEPNVADDVRKHMQRFPKVDLDHVTFFVGRSIL